MNTHRKRILYFFLIAVGITVITVLINGAGIRAIPRMFIEPWYWVIMACISLLGFGLGWIGYELNLRSPKNKNRIFIIGHCIGILLLIAFIISTIIPDDIDRSEDNSRSNYDMIFNRPDLKNKFLEAAFRRLQAEFTDRNDFRLTSYSISPQDSLNSTPVDTFYRVYFTYSLKGDDNANEKWLSKIEVFDDSTNLVLHKVDYRQVEEFMADREKTEKLVYSYIDSLHYVVKNLPETASHRKQLEELIEVFKKGKE
jgi:hypothetical protein